MKMRVSSRHWASCSQKEKTPIIGALQWKEGKLERGDTEITDGSALMPTGGDAYNVPFQSVELEKDLPPPHRLL